MPTFAVRLPAAKRGGPRERAVNNQLGYVVAAIVGGLIGVSPALAQPDGKGRGAGHSPGPAPQRSAPPSRPSPPPRAVQPAPRVQAAPPMRAPRVQAPAPTARSRNQDLAPQRRSVERRPPQAPPAASRAQRQPDARSLQKGEASRRQLERRQVERRPEPPKTAPKVAPGIASPDRSKSVNAPPPNASGRRQVNRTQITDEQRLRVRQDVLKRKVDRIRRSRVDFALSVGSRVPRRHRLHRLPPAIFAYAPFYRGYDYLLVEDNVYIVDPETYLIADVLPATIEQAASPRPAPALRLSAEEMRFVWANVPKDVARLDLRVRLGLGATIRPSVELYRFPGTVIDRVPQLEGFRYVLVDDDVVVVDPADRSVVLVITP